MFKMSKKDVYDKYTKRLEKQMYLAKESPEPIYDVSSCNLSEVPKAVFSYCKILQKETLLLYDNKLKCFKEGLRDLHTIQTLDLHSNLLSELPWDMSLLKSLSHLDLSSNKLSSLPLELASLKNLQELNINDNCFKHFPPPVTSITSLRQLNISHNCITTLPKDLHQLKALTALILDADVMLYPDKNICKEGTDCIMKFLCSESNVNYEPLSNEEFIHKSDPPSTTTSLPPTPLITPHPSQNSVNNLTSSSETDINSVFMVYELAKEQRRQERVVVERRVMEDQQRQDLVAAHAANNKKQMILFLSEEHSRFNDEISSVQRKKTCEKNKLIQYLHNVEEMAASLVEKFVRTNEQARRTEELMDTMEKQRLEREEWHVVRKEEVDSLRKKDIAESFAKMLSNADVMGELIGKYVGKKQEIIHNSILDMNEKDEMLGEMFNNLKDDKHLLIGKLLNEERVQREAFEMLQHDRDTCHSRVASQINMVEYQLCQLTFLELDKKASQLDDQMNNLEDNRVMLTKLLRQLLAEREMREEELKKRLLEMEERSNTHQLNYWLVQYQRLLDSKPQLLFEETSRLEWGVVDVLERAGAGEFKPIFAHKAISIEALMHFDNDDLKQLGISNATMRTQILTVLESMTIHKLKEEFTPLQPSAPIPVDQSTPSQSQLNNECVICLSERSNILFLNCGHICTCQLCAEPLTQCPMDRIKIEQKIKIYVTA